MTNETKEDPYTGEETPESQELIDKVRRLSPGAQSVLYAMKNQHNAKGSPPPRYIKHALLVAWTTQLRQKP